MTVIVHATDLVSDDNGAFVHAVALARGAGSELVSLHANDSPDSMDRMPQPDGLLTQWGDEPGSVPFRRTVHNCCEDPVDTILDGISKLAPDLIVAASHHRSALSRFFASNSADAIAHNAKMPVLLMPEGAKSFVKTDGGLDLRKILVPIGDPEEAQVAMATAAWMAKLAGVDEVEFTLLHIGEHVEVDASVLSERPGWSVQRVEIPGRGVDKAILDKALDSSLVVMATRGHDSVGNVLAGSHTDHVAHESKCPVLSIGVKPQ
jgi:nucleotide-binding universal stress UspA family protein